MIKFLKGLISGLLSNEEARLQMEWEMYVKGYFSYLDYL